MSKISKELYDTIFKLLNEEDVSVIHKETNEQLSAIDPAMKLSESKVDIGKPVESKSVRMKPKLKESIVASIRSKLNLIK